MKEKIFVSKNNIFDDLDLKDSEELKTRSDLMSELVHIIRNSGMPQKEIAKILGITPSKVSALMSGKINDFSNDTLMNYLTLLGCNVEIKVVTHRPVRKSMKRGVMKVQRTRVTPKLAKPRVRRRKKPLCYS